MPPFGPSLPKPPIFTNHQEFREFLLVKCMFDIDFRVSLQVFIQIMFCNKAINGEKAAFNNTVFGRRKRRTIEAIIKNMHLNFDKDSILKVSTERHTKL